MATNQEYGNDSIDVLEGARRVRNNPAALLGSNGLAGAKHTVIEIIGNSTDEKLAGFGNQLDLSVYEDGSISIRDYGRGVPIGWNEAKQKWNYFLIYEELWAGGKYSSNQEILEKIEAENSWADFKFEDYPYLITIGMNGVGGAATQFTADYFDVKSYRDGTMSEMYYEDGAHVWDELKTEPTNEPNGTFIKWKISDQAFSDTNIPSKWFEKLCSNMSYVTGFKVVFNYKGVEKVFEAKTLEEVMKESTGACASTSKFVHLRDDARDICICQADVAIGPNGRGSEFFHNKVEMTGGIHADSYHTAVGEFFNGISREVGVRIRDVDYAGKFSIISSTLSNKMSPKGQTKDSIDDAYIFHCLYDCILDTLNLEHQKGTEWLQDIVDEAVQNAQNRIAVAEMSKNLKEVEKATKKAKASQKFVSCKSYRDKDPAATEFFIVEGDSAAGKVLVARDSAYQCYLAIRGKSLNVYKATLEQLIANAEIRDIISVLGCGVDLGIEEYESFDISKLKVGKIIFCADADVDGKHIMMLLFLIIWKLCPELLYQGYVYTVDTPLYVINTVDGQAIYCMDNEELEEKKAEVVGRIHSIDRFKGLGETDEDTLWNTTLNPETRNLRQIKIDRNDTDIIDVLEVLFGKSTARRKEAILGSIVGGNFDEMLGNIENLNDYVDGLDLNQLEVEEVKIG